MPKIDLRVFFCPLLNHSTKDHKSRLFVLLSDPGTNAIEGVFRILDKMEPDTRSVLFKNGYFTAVFRVSQRDLEPPRLQAKVV